MKIFHWHKLSQKHKAQIRSIRPLTLLLGPIYMDPNQIKKIAKKYSKNSTLIFGILKDRWIPELENCEQFHPLSKKQLTNALSGQEKNNIAILEHFFVDNKYIIRELRPNKVLFINGSTNRALHYTEPYWQAIDIKAKIKRLSPFNSEETAKKHAKKICNLNEKLTISKLKSYRKFSPENIMEFCNFVKKSSWVWYGQTGAAIVRNNKILTYSHDVVVPYESALLHQGSIREQMRTPIGEHLEYYRSNHAEPGAILKLCKIGKTLEDSELYTSKFPCPFCARIIANSPIKTIYYRVEYANRLGYEILKQANKKLIAI